MSAETPEKKSDSAQDKKDQPTAQLNNLNQLAKALQSFLEQLAQLIVTKNWVPLLLIIDAALIILCYPGGILPKFLESTFALELPQVYSAYFGITVGAIFLAALVIAIRTILRKPPPPPDFTERKAIKGLQAYSREDAVIFAQLQRDRDLRECLEAITSKTFRFGILMGESGVGKTSFLQAGIIPQLNQTESKFKGIYIRFSNQDPITTIYQALTAELATPAIAINEQDLLEILAWAIDTSEQSLILIFDQFEQFFVHYKQKIDREPFIEALTSWYCATDSLPVKILISIRGDLADKLIELQKALGYSLTPYEVFRLERFSPTEATRILQVIAQAEAIKFDEKFVRELTAEELASNEDGLISPVDLQVLARTIERQKNQELQAFNRSAFQKIGGIEGLMTRFLNTTFDARLPSQRQAAIKVLLAMTDLERNVRAGVLTLQNLQQKIQGTLTPGEIVEATTWLASGNVRLITQVEQDVTNGYELAHERLIPALREVAGKELTSADRANQLLNRRVNEWLGNNRSARYLFNWQELRLFQQQKPYLVWGTNRNNKERLLQRSWRRLSQQLVALAMLLIVALVGMGWWHSPNGQIQQVRWELGRLSKRVGYEYRGKAALAFGKDGDLAQVLTVTDSIKNSSNKAEVLITIAETIGKVENFPQADKHLAQAIIATEQIESSSTKAEVLITIAETISKLENFPQADQYLAQAIIAMEQIEDLLFKPSVLNAIAEAYGKLGKFPQADQYLAQAITAAEKITVSISRYQVLMAIAVTHSKLGKLEQDNKYFAQVLSYAEEINAPFEKRMFLQSIAEAIGEIENFPQADQYLARIITSAEVITDSFQKTQALKAIAEAIGEIENFPQADQYLARIITSAEAITDSSQKTQVLKAIVDTIGKIGNFPQADQYLARIITATEKSESSFNKVAVLTAIAETFGKLQDFPQVDKFLAHALTAAQQTEYYSGKAKGLTSIAETIGKLENFPQADKYLTQVITATQEILNSDDKAEVLTAIAETIGKLENFPQADKYLVQVITATEEIFNSNDKSEVLTSIAQTQAKLARWRQANNTVNLCPTDECKVESLAHILTAWAEKKNPAVK